ncbi:MAG: methyltransferase domain-containing protein [Candidatus Cloacimonetes bacterium]|nr:methyltransferase domain-containing protein [Candidatus Cloacimonadota bacterium]
MSNLWGSFQGKAELYSKFRPHYSHNYREYLIQKLQIDRKARVADIGAGTGIHTKALIGIAGNIIAIEPNPEMLQQCLLTLGDCNNVKILLGSAEMTTLPDLSINYITVSQAFHLFNKQNSLNEFKRILHPQGSLILVWISKEHDNELFYENEKAIKQFCPNYQRHIHARYFIKETFKNCFTSDTYTFVRIPNDSTEFLDKKTFIMRTLSASYALNSSDKNYNALVQELGNVFDRYSDEGAVKVPQSTVIYHGKIK